MTEKIKDGLRVSAGTILVSVSMIVAGASAFSYLSFRQDTAEADRAEIKITAKADREESELNDKLHETRLRSLEDSELRRGMEYATLRGDVAELSTALARVESFIRSVEYNVSKAEESNDGG